MLRSVLQCFNAPVVYSANGSENQADLDDEDSIYILTDFEGEIFQRLCNCYCRVVAPPVIIWAATHSEVSVLIELLSPYFIFTVFLN